LVYVSHQDLMPGVWKQLFHQFKNFNLLSTLIIQQRFVETTRGIRQF